MRGTYRPRVDMLDHASAAAILGVTVGTVARYIARGLLAPVEPFRTAQLRLTDVEQLTASRWREGDDADGSSYFVSLTEAARILDLSTTRVGQLATAGRLPYVETALTQPRRLYRRVQLEVIARARQVRAEMDGSGVTLAGCNTAREHDPHEPPTSGAPNHAHHPTFRPCDRP